MIILLSVLAIVHGLEKLFHFNLFNFKSYDSSAILSFILYFVVLLIGLIPVYFPAILYGYPRVQTAANEKVKPVNVDEEQKYNLDEEEIKQKLQIQLSDHSYLNPDFTLSSCARQLDIPTHHLSYFISKIYDQNFTAFKNHLRIAHAKKLIAEGYLESNTVDALALTCGYGNRSSFSKTFKALTNQNPSEYPSHLQ